MGDRMIHIWKRFSSFVLFSIGTYNPTRIQNLIRHGMIREKGWNCITISNSRPCDFTDFQFPFLGPGIGMIYTVFFSAGQCIHHVLFKYIRPSFGLGTIQTNWAGLMIFDSLTKKLPRLSAALTWSVSRLMQDITTPLRVGSRKQRIWNVPFSLISTPPYPGPDDDVSPWAVLCGGSHSALPPPHAKYWINGLIWPVLV